MKDTSASEEGKMGLPGGMKVLQAVSPKSNKGVYGKLPDTVKGGAT